jgi:hypothetical protein
MTKPQPKPLGTSIEVREGATVLRPGEDTAAERVVTGGVYVLDVPGEHIVDGKAIEVADAAATEAAGS